MAVLPNGTLWLSLQKDDYETLGLQGQRSKFSPSRHGEAPSHRAFGCSVPMAGACCLKGFLAVYFPRKPAKVGGVVPMQTVR